MLICDGCTVEESSQEPLRGRVVPQNRKGSLQPTYVLNLKGGSPAACTRGVRRILKVCIYNVLCDYNSYGSNELRVRSVTVEVRSGIAC